MGLDQRRGDGRLLDGLLACHADCGIGVSPPFRRERRPAERPNSHDILGRNSGQLQAVGRNRFIAPFGRQASVAGVGWPIAGMAQ
jgi:hypothetical protein